LLVTSTTAPSSIPRSDRRIVCSFSRNACVVDPAQETRPPCFPPDDFCEDCAPAGLAFLLPSFYPSRLLFLFSVLQSPIFPPQAISSKSLSSRSVSRRRSNLCAPRPSRPSTLYVWPTIVLPPKVVASCGPSLSSIDCLIPFFLVK